MTIQERAFAAIARGSFHDPGEITLDSTFDQLSADSLIRLQILFELEQEFKIQIPDSVASQTKSVREVITRLTEVLGTTSV
jgi:acyl carrier protein